MCGRLKSWFFLFAGACRSDHLYLYPNGVKLDDEIRAAQELGMRFHPARGTITIGYSKGNTHTPAAAATAFVCVQPGRCAPPAAATMLGCQPPCASYLTVVKRQHVGWGTKGSPA